MLEQLARLGYASKAVIYAIVGMLAILTAANRGGAVTDMNGALLVVLALPLGRVMLIVLAVGLCSYGIWRLLDAFSDPDGDGTTPVGLITRIGNVARACVYGAVGVEAVRLIMRRRGSRGDQAELWTARIFDGPFGAARVDAPPRRRVQRPVVPRADCRRRPCLRGRSGRPGTVPPHPAGRVMQRRTIDYPPFAEAAFRRSVISGSDI